MARHFQNRPTGVQWLYHFECHRPRQQTIDNLIVGNATIIREILSNIPEKQKELLYAIAREGEAERITSSEFIKKHSLSSASSIQSAQIKLLEKDLVTELNKKYSVTDTFFGMWINTIYGNKYVF